MATMNGKRLIYTGCRIANSVRVRNLIFRKMFHAIRVVLARLSKSMVFVKPKSSPYLNQINSSYLYCTS